MGNANGTEKFERRRWVSVGQSGVGPYSQTVLTRRHIFTADEPEGLGGADTGPDPIELLLSSLATCTAMTVRMYCNQKKIDIGKLSVVIYHEWAKDSSGKTVDRIEKELSFDPPVAEVLKEKLLNIADRCPVHRAIQNVPEITTRIVC